MEKLIAELAQNKELKEKIEAMWTKGASAQDVADTLTAAGLKTDAAQAEELLALLKKAQAEEIELEDVDPDLLRRVAGGGFAVSCVASEFSACNTNEDTSWVDGGNSGDEQYSCVGNFLSPTKASVCTNVGMIYACTSTDQG